MKVVRVGVLGAGVVGGSFLQLLEIHKLRIQKEHGLDLQLTAVATRTPDKIKSSLPSSVFLTTDVISATNRSDIDLIVELIGGTDLAFTAVSNALATKKTIVTANKALLSEKGRELFPSASKNGVEIGFEAAVAGSIPIVRTLRDGFASSEFAFVCGILNGTTNFILTKMAQENWDYPVALRKAQELGFAEADPTFDVEGIDAGHKISLLASLAFRRFVPFSSVRCSGISQLESTDILAAQSLGYTIKLLGIATKIGERFATKVSPTLVPKNHPLAHVDNESNAIFYKTMEADTGMMTGKGAGGFPTASAVLSDVIYYGKRLHDASKSLEANVFPEAESFPTDEAEVRYYLRFSTVDEPGVLSEIAKILGKQGISIASVQQKESQEEPVSVVIVTHQAKEGSVRKALSEIESLAKIIKRKTVSIPILENF